MSDEKNPWQSPENASVQVSVPGAQTALTETMLRYLREASPWLRFLGILGFICAGFVALTGVIVSITMLAVDNGVTEEYSGIVSALIGLVYVGLGVVAFFPARFTYYFGAKIRSYQASHSEEDLEQALKNNKSLWKFCGILCIINLAFVPLVIVGGIIAVVGGFLANFSNFLP